MNMRQGAKYLATGLCAVALLLMIAWGMLAIFYADFSGETTRACVAFGFPVATLLAFIFLQRRWALAVFLALFASILGWWLTLPASNFRQWQPDVSVLSSATVQGDFVTVHNIRNLQYRTETDFDVRYYDKTFDLRQLDSVDLIAVYWAGDAIAHIMVSFGFQEKDFVTFSIETRKEVGEGYSTLKGFFKQYELMYITGDERDLIRVRTDYRQPPEDVYLYRTRMPPERARLFFLEYVRQINALKEKPEWYNTLTTNCTTAVVRNLKIFGNRVQYNWKVLLSGYTPLYAYELAALDTSIPFEQLRLRSYINPKARAVGNDVEFSRKIREGLPRPKQ